MLNVYLRFTLSSYLVCELFFTCIYLQTAWQSIIITNCNGRLLSFQVLTFAVIRPRLAYSSLHFIRSLSAPISLFPALYTSLNSDYSTNVVLSFAQWQTTIYDNLSACHINYVSALVTSCGPLLNENRFGLLGIYF